MPHHYETVPDKELSNAERVELSRPSSRLDVIDRDRDRTLRLSRRNITKDASYSLTDIFSAVPPIKKKKTLQCRTRSLSSSRSLLDFSEAKVLVPDTQETTVPSTQPDEVHALDHLDPHPPARVPDAHLTPLATPATNALGLSQVSNDSIEGYQGTPPDATVSATSTQISNSTIEGYPGTQEDAFPPCAQIPRAQSVAASPSTSPRPPTPAHSPGLYNGIYGEPAAPPVDPSTAHPLHANTAGRPDIDWLPTQEDGPVREYFKLFDVDFNDDSDVATQYKMNNAIILSLNNVIRNCEKSSEAYSSDILLGFLLNSIFKAYEAGSMMMGWDKNAVARQVSFHANQTEVFQSRVTNRFDPLGNHADKFGSYHSSTVPPYSNKVLQRSRAVRLFHDEDGVSVLGYDDDAIMSDDGSNGTEVSDVLMERAKEGLKDSIHAAPAAPVVALESLSQASSLPMEADFAEWVHAELRAIKSFVGMPGKDKGKGRQVSTPTPSPAPPPPIRPASSTPYVYVPHVPISRGDLQPVPRTMSPSVRPDSPNYLPPLPAPLPRIHDSSAFLALPPGPPDVTEFTPALTKNQKKAAKRAEKKKTMAETVVAALEADPARVPTAPKSSKPAHAPGSKTTNPIITPQYATPSAGPSKPQELSVVARFHTKITQEGIHKLPPRIFKERIDAFFKGRVGTGKLRLSTAHWNGAGNLVLNFPPSTDASLIFNKEDDLKSAMKLPGPATFQRNTSWKKVMINGVCTGMNRDGTGSVYSAARLTEELRDAHSIFRTMKFTQELRFLATREVLTSSEHRSVLICFEDHTGSVWQSLRSTHFNMFAKPVSFREFNDKQVLRVCLKCHSYDHEGATCKATTLCSICSGAHPDSQHKKHCNRKQDSCKGTVAAAAVTHAKTCGACKRLNDKNVRWDHAFDAQDCPSKTGYRIPAYRVMRSHAPSHMIPSHPAVPNADEPSASTIFGPAAPADDTVMTNTGPGEATTAVAE
ncbi:hypothetical protein BDV93DRAFT_561277 [Ceratobasidium sp. AG-I]|nr:hypothetical protein BDV93DRAFT_561277 [Ceratobasidium sp. AG-I]